MSISLLTDKAKYTIFVPILNFLNNLKMFVNLSWHFKKSMQKSNCQAKPKKANQTGKSGHKLIRCYQGTESTKQEKCYLSGLLIQGWQKLLSLISVTLLIILGYYLNVTKKNSWLSVMHLEN